MKTLAVTALSLFLVLNPSLAKTGTGTQAQASPKRSVLTNPMRMKNAVARAVPRAQRRLLVTNDLSDGDDGPPGPGELDLHQSYRRPELVKEHTVDDPELSDYVRTRLLIARVRALKKYQEVWA